MDPVTLHDHAEEITILDVRELGEWQAGHIDGAVHVPLSQLPARIGEIDRTRPIAVVCRSGNRSGAATRFLQRQGVDAQNVAGGMVAWAMHRLPVVTDGGRPGRVA